LLRSSLLAVLLGLTVACGETEGAGPNTGGSSTGGFGDAGSGEGGAGGDLDGGSGGDAGGAAGAVEPIGGAGSSSTPVVPRDRVAVGTLHGCAIDESEQIVCWGDPAVVGNEYDMGQTEPPPGDYVHVACQGYTCCAINTFDQAQCWGEIIGLGASGDAINVSPGAIETCLVRTDHTGLCTRNAADSNDLPGRYVQVSIGQTDFGCALTDGGAVDCWGNDDYGQTDVPSGTFSYISAGGAHACGIRLDGSVACWGRDDRGQASPQAGVFTHLSAGRIHTCGVKEDGLVECWGAGESSVDCEGNADCGQAAPPPGNFVQVSAAYTHTCGLKEDGSLACWGSNTGDRSTPPTDFRSW
jgi:alpha-tubulin suppressor-like RCC1 family protein